MLAGSKGAGVLAFSETEEVDGGTEDAGTEDGGVEDAGITDAGPADADGDGSDRVAGGCGCTSPGVPVSGLSLLFGLLGLT